ncbi:hypothetical protein R5R35_011282 [Gryllus longicercus]|uniref:Multidrug resistance-associated protein lethal(2)03659 n=1 Tax=Gryllus longicercus TaxID=2509291 RepID=A0AAN9Z460_9ORTH
MDTGTHKRRPNPRETANPLSALFFTWTYPLFRTGLNRDITLEDLYDPRKKDYSQGLGDNLERCWRKEELKASARGRKPSLRSALVSCFGGEYLGLGLLVLVSDVFGRLLQPQLLGGLLRSLPSAAPKDEHGNPLDTEDDELRLRRALYYAGGMVAVVAVQTLCFNHYLLGAYHMGMRVRASTCSLIYRKALRLSQTALGDTAAGQVVNLLSNDVSRFDLVSTFVHYMWAAPLVTVGAAGLMYKEVGWPAFVGVGTVLAIVPLQAYVGSLLARFRKRTAGRTDERVRFMDEVVSGIRVIKMYAWEKPFTELVRLARRLEISVLRKTSFCRAFFMTIILSITRVGLFSTLITMALTDRRLTSDAVFVVLAYFNVMAHIVCVMFIRGVAEVAEAQVSVRRLEKFLLHDEFVATLPPPGAAEESKKPLEPATGDGVPPTAENKEGPALLLQKATFRWEAGAVEPTLQDLSMDTKRGELVAVVGQVGAGKSSLLQALLGELPAESGSVRVDGRVSYASQEPWVFAATVRQNILFGLEFDARRYERVVRVCALKRDFELLPRGDMTVVGQRGAALSGGQKARINLARAVYREADVYLLDDPLSAVDTHVGRHLFDECIMGFLAGKTRVLVTHQLQYLQDANRIILLHNGQVQMQGDFNTLTEQVDYQSLIGESHDEEADESDGEEDADKQSNKDAGSVGKRDSVTKVGRLLRRISSTRSRASSKRDVAEEPAVGTGGGDSEEDRQELSSKGRTQGKSPYLEYFRAGTRLGSGQGFGAQCASTLLLTGLALLFLLAQGTISTCDWFVSFWTRQEERREKEAADPDVITSDIPDVHMYVYIYTGLVCGLLLLALSRSLSFYTVAMRCSEHLHHAMFSSVLRTRVRFFDVNPSGRILNRFSKDMGTCDEQLPISMLDATQIILQVVGAVTVSAVVNQWLLIPVAVLAVIFWGIRIIYLRTSQNIKRLEGIAKSPVFSHLHATLQGLTTVRAFSAQDVLKAEFDKHQDLHSAAWYMFITTSNAFGFSLDVLVTLYITFVTFSLIFLGGKGDGVGLAITQAMSLSGVLQWGVRQSAEVANNIMAVERVLEYSVLDPEPNLEAPPAPPAPKGWPSAGELRFNKLSLTYGPKDPPVLHNLTLHIRPGEKVGVVGRTGAGKSSLIAALFRLAWSVDGQLELDGVDTARVALQELRARLAVIPQDPVLFSGTLRRNLDPFDEFADVVLWQAVEEVELREALPEAAGLEARVAEGGSNFSVGQRQLVCLARALLRGARVLVLDEATANVDPRTDALIQRTLRRKFNDCSVITVAHRLNTVMDSDKVLVMDAGQVAEFDHPHLLLQRRGIFHSMVAETGRAMAEQLAKVAEEAYNKQQR